MVSYTQSTGMEERYDMNVTVKDFISSYITTDKDALSRRVYVRMIGNGEVIEDWYNECPWMFEDANVLSWNIKDNLDGETNRRGNKIVTLYIVAK